MAIFTLEALQADHGDSLLLHYGAAADPRLIVIDGGPKGIYKSSLSPRLNKVRQARGGGRLEVRMVMVSHIDDDHITGILDLTRDLSNLQQSSQALPYDILTLWHNSFDDLASKLNAEAQVHLRSAKGATMEGGAIAASVGQGRELRANANSLSLNVNSGFNDLVQFDASKTTPMNIGQGLSFTVLGPRKAQLDNLQKDWDKKVQELLKKKKSKPGASVSPTQLDAVAADFVDTSIPNLSSIVVLAQCAGKSMLLTGDANGKFILESLKDANLLKDGKLHVDILKAPHHGSVRDIKDVFFQTIVADNYVFSANGKYGNPDQETFEVLFKARPQGGYTLWLTNNVPERVKFIQKAISGKKSKVSNVVLKVRDDSAPSVKVELGEKITF